jgi:hypothetical protein
MSELARNWLAVAGSTVALLPGYCTGLISKEIQQTAYVKLRQVEKPVHTRKINRFSTNTNSNTKNLLRKNGKTKLT